VVIATQPTMKFILSRKIAQALRQGGFFGCIIYGAQRLGKSSYAAQVMHEIYGDWGKVNDHMLFELEDVVAVLKDASNKGKVIPVLTWDDCGVHGNKLLYFQNRLLVQYLSSLIDVVGVSLGGLIMTTPSPLNLLSALRGYEFYRIKVVRRDSGNGRQAIAYNSKLLPSGTRLITRDWKDNYRTLLPDDFWKPYMQKRMSYLKEGLDKLDDLVKQKIPSGRLTASLTSDVSEQDSVDRGNIEEY